MEIARLSDRADTLLRVAMHADYMYAETVRKGRRSCGGSNLNESYRGERWLNLEPDSTRNDNGAEQDPAYLCDKWLRMRCQALQARLLPYVINLTFLRLKRGSRGPGRGAEQETKAGRAVRLSAIGLHARRPACWGCGLGPTGQVDLSGYTNLLTSLLRLCPKESFPVNPKASIMDHKYKRSPDDSEKYFEHAARGQTKQGMLTVPHKLTPQERCEAP
jgi:hypothetical protein